MSNGKTICTVCNYIYDEASQSLKFEGLPDEWKCPECRSDKDKFQQCSCVSLPASEQTCAVHRGEGNSGGVLINNAEGALNKGTPVGQLVAQSPLRACDYREDICRYNNRRDTRSSNSINSVVRVPVS